MNARYQHMAVNDRAEHTDLLTADVLSRVVISVMSRHMLYWRAEHADSLMLGHAILDLLV